MIALCEMTFVLMSMNIAWPKKSAIAGPIDAGNENKAPLPGTSEGDAVLKHPTKAIKAPKISNVDFMYTFVKNVSTFLVCSMLSTVVSFAYLIVFNTAFALLICLVATALKSINSNITKPKMHNFSVQNPFTFVVKNVRSPCFVTHANKNAKKFNPTSAASKANIESESKE